MSYSTIAIIYNPISTGESESLAKNVIGQIRHHMPNQHVQLHATEHGGHAETLAYEIAVAHERPLIISSSGDGGYNEVINGAMRAQKEGKSSTVSLLPAGNANDHYRNLHGDTDVFDLISTNVTDKIDLLKLSGTKNNEPFERYAHSYIGFGLTPSIGNELNKQKLNYFNERLIVILSLFRLASVPLKIEKNDVHSYYSVICSNVDAMSKYLQISQPSSISDGKFEVTIFKKYSKVKLLITLIKATLSLVKEDMRTSSLALKIVRKTLVQLDGEVFRLDANTTALITTESQALTTLVTPANN